MRKQLHEAIRLLTMAEGVLGDIERDLIEPERHGVASPGPKDLINDCMDMIDQVIDTLEDL